MDNTPVTIGPAWGAQRTIPQWLKEILQETGLIDELGQLVNITSEVDRGIERHNISYHES